MLQNIINFLTQNAFLILIIGGGLFNVLVRLAQKAKEQRGRRDAHKELARQKQESLRTGRPIPTQRPQEPTLTAPAANPKAERQQRIEALRQERMEQLRALREKRASVSIPSPAVSPSSISQNHPNLPPIPAQTPRQRQIQQRAQQQSPQQSRPSQQSRPQQPQRTSRVGSPRPGQSQAANQPRRRPQIVAPPQQAPSTRRRQPQPTAPRSNPTPEPQEQERHAGHVESLREASGKGSTRSSTQISARSLLRSKASVRQAFVLKEILDTPIALRNQDIESGSLFS